MGLLGIGGRGHAPAAAGANNGGLGAAWDAEIGVAQDGGAGHVPAGQPRRRRRRTQRTRRGTRLAAATTSLGQLRKADEKKKDCQRHLNAGRARIKCYQVQACVARLWPEPSAHRWAWQQPGPTGGECCRQVLKGNKNDCLRKEIILKRNLRDGASDRP